MPKLLLHQALGLQRPALAAAVGGGGKTTLLFALAAESAEHGMTIVTTTTKMTLPPESKQLPLIVGADEASRAAALDDAQRRGLSAAVVGAGRGDRGRILGVQPGWPARALRAPGVGLVAVEADGSAGRPFKAPAEHEPVIPDGVDLVIASLARKCSASRSMSAVRTAPSASARCSASSPTTAAKSRPKSSPPCSPTPRAGARMSPPTRNTPS